MDDLLARGFDVLDQIPKVFFAADEREQPKMLIALMEYLFPKAASTQLLINKSYSEEVQKMTGTELAAELESRAKILRESEQHKKQ